MSEYTEEIQEVFLQFMLSDPDLWVRSNSILDVSYFHKNLQPLIKLFREYSEQFNGLPKAEQIKAITNRDLHTILDITDADRDWFLDNIEKFCRQRSLEDWLYKGVEYVRDGKYGQLEAGLKESLLISLHKNLGTEYFDNAKERLERLKNNNGQIKTGWTDFDRKLYGGLNYGELHIFAGQSGSGKSLFLQNLTLNLALTGLNIVYISCELSEELVSMRIDCMLTGMGSQQLMKKLDDVDMIVRANKKKAGNVYIKEMAQGSTVNDIKAYLKEVEIQKGIRPDVLVVDYLDLLYPNDRRVDPSNLFIKDKFIAEELRALAREGLGRDHRLLCLTASQLNRSSVEEQEHNHAHIAGGKSKIDTADGVYSIHTSKSMRERGYYQLQLLKTRNSAGTGDKVSLGYNIDTMRIADLEEDIVVDDIITTMGNNSPTVQTKSVAIAKPKTTARNILQIVNDLKQKK